MKLVLAIALGGAIGSVLRHYAGKAALLALGPAFPYGTLFVNVVGSFAIGILIAWFAHQNAVSNELRAFLTVGLLGGFTTFSTFSLDAVTLMERGETMTAFFYILASVLVSIAAVFSGLFLVRQFTA